MNTTNIKKTSIKSVKACFMAEPEKHIENLAKNSFQKRQMHIISTFRADPPRYKWASLFCYFLTIQIKSGKSTEGILVLILMIK